MNTKKLTAGFLGLIMAAAMAQAENKNFSIPLSNTVNLDMIWIEPGTFMMGSPENEMGRQNWGEDLHEVTLSQGFWLGKYEVTQAQYKIIMGDNPTSGMNYGVGSNYPVYYMTWKEATNFCAKLTEIERTAGRLPKGYEYTLPTSEQWEYACRAETTTAFNNGTNIAKKDESEYETCPNLEPLAWYMSNSGRRTHPVGLKQPNAWGLYDMHGNVDEACIDEMYSGNYNCRGGWFGMGAMYARSAYRMSTGPNERSVGTGFRVALVRNVPEEPSKIEYTVSNEELILNFTGELYESDDAVNWTKVESAVSPYKVKIGDRKQFFTFKEGSSVDPVDPSDPEDQVLPGENAAISLPDNVDLDMVGIEPGTFMMGSPKNELGRENKETLHQVTLTKGYWLGKYEVTQAQYKAVTGTNPSWDKGADLPVEQVTWNDAMEFCSKLTDIEREAGRLPEGYEYTLPTEAQWEYACRAGTTTALNSGKNLSDEYQCPEMDEVGWYWYNGGKESYNNNLICTHSGGQKKPNAWGLYDMHGNVGEWCLDWYEDYPTTAVVDPTGPDTGTDRAVRWGSWWNAAWACRSAYRGNDKPDAVYASLGFRVALAPVVISDDGDMTIPISGDVNLAMVWIEPGTFMMGSPENERGRENYETQHEVTLTQGYWLGKYEVTQKQYQAIMGKNPSKFQGATLPVEKVSWEDAMAFCAKLTASEREAGRLPAGYEYTLPTEAQWEYACRAETTTALNSGKNLSNISQCTEMNEVGWYGGNSGNMTHSVGQKKPNAWGLYDMHGNVLEWCLDWNGSYPLAPEVDPKGPNNGTSRVIRGGGWNLIAGSCRSASRSNYGPTYSSYFCGFRVALSSVQAIDKDIRIPLSDTVNLDMIWIEPGSFMMGSPEGEKGRDAEETQHRVILTQGYWLGKFEVTQGQYKAIMGSNPSYYGGDEKPVEQVRWETAMEFCAKLTEIEKAAGRLPDGYKYTLPTEAQWEYACRAGTTTALNSGKNLSNSSQCPEVEKVAWYFFSGAGMTSVVGQKQPNAWGLYDMHGNVKEWCLDWYNENYYQSSPSEDPTGPAAPIDYDYNNYKVVRGGGWATYAYDCRSASRGKYYEDRYDRYTGFRVALVPEK
ncbi:MAG: formylglycine-generating enzyme family protein [Verrucomicrobia bacterium]|nr:formylglycine-generating enzyme family protein [Verrucomicrobiota bacterium]